MKHDELERLLWEQAEGSIGAADRTRLDACLAADPAAEQARHRVVAVAEMLGSVGEVAPPPGLQARIEAAVAGRRRPRPRLTWSAVLAEVLAPKWRVRIAWAVVGLVVGTTATVLMIADFGHASRDDLSRYYGAMAQPGPVGRVLLPDSLGAICVSLADGSLAIDLEVSRPVAGGVRVEVTGGDLTVESFQGTAASRVEVAGGAVAATVEGAGKVTARIRVLQQGKVLLLRVSAAGEQVFERSIGAAVPPPG